MLSVDEKAQLSLQQAALDHFYNGQDAANAGNNAGSRAELQLAVGICEKAGRRNKHRRGDHWQAADSLWHRLGVGPPFELIGSAAWNCIGTN